MSRSSYHRYSFLLLLLLFVTMNAQGQAGKIRIHGLITTPAEPASYATVTLSTPSGAVKVTAVQSNADGVFELTVTPGVYLLEVSFLGYETLSRKLVLTPAIENIMLKDLALLPSAKKLAEVVIQVKKSALVISGGKQVFDISQSLVSKGGSVADALKEVPSLNVSPGGKLTLRNGTPVILVDGKRTLLKLDQIPADQIQSVEIMTNPSVKYDANGTSGIVNIIMKKNRKTGISALFSENFTSLPENTVNAELNVRKQKFNIALYYTLHNHQNKGEGTTDRQSLQNSQRFLQQKEDKTKDPFQSGRIVLDYAASASNTFSFNGNLSGADFHTNASQTTRYLDEGRRDSSGIRQTMIDSRFTSWRLSLDHTHNFNTNGEKLVSGIYSQFYKGPDKGNYEEEFYKANDSVSRLPFLQQYANTIKAHTINFQSDYTLPLKDNRLEAGIKINLHKDDNINMMEDLDQATSTYQLNRLASYHYGYNDNTYAAYTAFSGKKGTFSYLAGLRYELYDFRGHMTDNNQIFAYQNPGIYPSIFLTKKLREGQELHLNYSRRVNRPEFDQISPRIDFTNPLNLQQGNTHLLSEYSNLMEFSYNYDPGDRQLVTTLYYRNTNHLITQYTSVFSSDTLISRYANAGYSNSYGAELTLKTPLTSFADVTANVNALETRINASNLQSGLSNSGFTWFTKLNSEIRLPSAFIIQITGNYHAAEVMPQGKNLSYGSVDFAASHSFLRSKALSLTASLTDIFNTQQDRARITIPGLFNQEIDYKPLTRVFQLNLSYHFGKKQT